MRMRYLVLLAILAAVAVILAFTGRADAAQPHKPAHVTEAPHTGKSNDRPCATTGEWNQINPRMSRAQVYDIMDGAGFAADTNVRGWNICPEYLKPNQSGMMSVWFKNNVVYGVYWMVFVEQDPHAASRP